MRSMDVPNISIEVKCKGKDMWLQPYRRFSPMSMSDQAFVCHNSHLKAPEGPSKPFYNGVQYSHLRPNRTNQIGLPFDVLPCTIHAPPFPDTLSLRYFHSYCESLLSSVHSLFKYLLLASLKHNLIPFLLPKALGPCLISECFSAYIILYTNT